MARYFPSALNVANRHCLVIGNDREAMEKSLRLLEAGAQVTVTAPDFSSHDESQLATAGARIVRADYERVRVASDLFFVVLCPKDRPSLSERIAQECRDQRVLLCAIDQPTYCDVVNVSVMDAGPLRITIGTGGSAPSIARKIREGLERALKTADVLAYLESLGHLRAQLERDLPDPTVRREALLRATNDFQFDVTVKIPPRSSPVERGKSE